MTRAYTWEQLRRLTLPRQFPSVRGRGVPAVVEAATRIGPLQTQTARSAFLGLGARLPGVTHATVTEAYESARLVRGSTLRGTVHTVALHQHPLLEVATRLGQRAMWARTFGLTRTTLEEAWEGIEAFARREWRTPEQLREHLAGWLQQHESDESAAAVALGAGRSLAFGHGGLVRRPLKGGWEGQGAPGYRWVGADLDGDGRAARDRLLAEPAAALTALVRLHLTAYGPSSRQDIAWWAGVGLRQVDAALETLRKEATVRPGPDGRDYWDLADGMPRATADVGARLLPEFDAVMVGYEPAARDRFMSPGHAAVLWNQANGLVLPPLLHEGRVSGYWRLVGNGRRRRLTVSCFGDAPRPDETALEGPVRALAAAMDLEVVDLAIGLD